MNGHMEPRMERDNGSAISSKLAGAKDTRLSRARGKGQRQASNGETTRDDAISMEIEKVKQSHKGAWA